MHSNSNTRQWALTSELQKKYDRVVAHTRRLQAEFGITPMTFEERAAAYTQRKQEKQRRQAELEELQKRIGQHRPPPRWKV